MLKKILSNKTCAMCRLCCQFDNTDTWEMPVLSDKTVSAVKALQPETEFIKVGNEMTFKTPILHEDELFSCPALTDNGCGLSTENKPFDCKIWPFRIMYDENGEKIITIAEICSGIENLSDDYLRDFLTEEKLDRIIFDFANSNPNHIKPIKNGYRPLLKEKNNSL